MRKLLLLLALVAPVCALGQSNYLTITTTNGIVDASGTALAQGTFCAYATDGTDSPIAFQIGGSFQAVKSTICRNIVGGTLAAAMQLANPAATQPLNIRYHVTVTNTATHQVTQYPGVSIVASGSTWDWSQWNPALSQPSIPVNMIPGTPGPTGLTGATGATGPTGSGSLPAGVTVTGSGASQTVGFPGTIAAGPTLPTPQQTGTVIDPVYGPYGASANPPASVSTDMLRHWHAKIATLLAAGTGTASVAVIGDSWTEGSTWTNPLTLYLRSRLGFAGPGWASFAAADYPVLGVNLASTGTWTDYSCGLGLTCFGGSFIDTVSLDSTTPASKTLTFYGSTTQVTVHYASQVGGGTFRWQVDGGSWTTVNTADTATNLQMVSITGLSGAAAMHTFTAQVLTAGTTGIRLFGANATNITPGVIVHRLGRSGMANGTMLIAGNTPVWKAALANLAPDLVIVALGTNEFGGGSTPTSSASGEAQTIAAIKAAVGTSDCAVMAFPDAGFINTNGFVPQDYETAYEYVAAQAGCAFIPIARSFGPYNANANGLYGSNQHPNSNGGTLIQNMVRRIILAPFDGPDMPLSHNEVAGAANLTTPNRIPFVSAAGFLSQTSMTYDSTFNTLSGPTNFQLKGGSVTNWGLTEGIPGWYDGAFWVANQLGLPAFFIKNNGKMCIGYNCFDSLTTLTVRDSTAATGATRFQIVLGAADTATTVTSINAGASSSSAFIPSGAAFSVAGCGTATGIYGGPTAGTFTAGQAACTPVITTGISVVHGYTCWMNDLSSPAVRFSQTSSSNTTATFTATGTLGATDVINFGCLGY